ncbi:MAG: hypothetical protein LUD46_19855 [Parabacteroides sp.]|nr:hypothetical protein [Parabacteroides sp.]
MKTKKTILLAALLLLGSICGVSQAQENLNALMKKCETMDKIDMNVIYNKNRETKKNGEDYQDRFLLEQRKAAE